MIAAAAEISLHGMDPMVFLETTDQLRRSVMEKTAEIARETLRRRDHERANLIASEIGKMLQAATSKKK